MRPSFAASTAAVLMATGLAMATQNAGAYVVSEDSFEEESTELGVVLRSFGFLFGGDVLEPPYTATDTSPSASGLFDGRLYFGHHESAFQIVFHNQLTLALSSHATGPLGLGRGLSPPRWLPISFRHDDDRLRLASNADWLYAAMSFGPATLTVGRQPITFGRGALWRTMDRVSTFALTEVDTSFKPGADALRFDINASEDTVVTAIAAIGELESSELDGEAELRGSTFLARLKQGWDGGEIGVTAGFVRYDAMAGVDVMFDLDVFELYAEATFTRVTARSLTTPAVDDPRVVSALVGASFRASPSVLIKPEVLYNGFGSFDSDDYLPQLLSERVGIGEQTNVGRLYVGGVVDHELTPLTHLVTSTLVNLHDPSALFSGALLYNMAQNVDFLVGGYLPVGERPTPLSAGPIPSLGSEFGSYPVFVFTELRGTI
jgi:hypothetical protein